MTQKNQPVERTEINHDGLRYAKKAAGSMYGQSGGQMMSCIRCGRHRPRSLLKPTRLAGAIHYRCGGGCEK